jgi:hypothetical protein
VRRRSAGRSEEGRQRVSIGPERAASTAPIISIYGLQSQ